MHVRSLLVTPPAVFTPPVFRPPLVALTVVAPTVVAPITLAVFAPVVQHMSQIVPAFVSAAVAVH